MKYFGTDGIRGIPSKTLTFKLIKKIAFAISYYVSGFKEKSVVIGNDSRESSDYIFSVIASVLLKRGINVTNVGICSSPCLAFITKKRKFNLGVMISASHNSKEFNGIKFFKSNGEKFSLKDELSFEKLIDSPFVDIKSNYSKLLFNGSLINEYIVYLSTLKNNNLNVIFDCANGGSSLITTKVYNSSIVINKDRTGKFINEGVGCTHIDFLKNLCVKERKIGVAFDGDGDRCIIVSENGTVISGDKILFILSKFLLNKGDVIVGTIETSVSLENNLKKLGIKLLRTEVGDKNIATEMYLHNYKLGGENSGHIIIRKYSPTGDGLITATTILNLLSISNLSLDEILKDYEQMKISILNIKLSKNFKEELLNRSDFKEYIKRIEDVFNIYILIRKSCTENVLRIKLEGNNYPSNSIFKLLKRKIKEL